MKKFTRYAESVTLAILFLCTPALQAQTTVPGWRQHTPLPTPLAGHGALLLSDGRVLLAGGMDANGAVTRSSYLLDPLTGTWTPTLNQLSAPRAYHALVSVATASGPRVFAVGGFAGSAGNYRGEATVEVLERDAGTGNWRWRTIGALSRARGDLRAAYDGAERIIVTGGYETTGGTLRSGARSVASDAIDVNTLQVRAIGDLATGRAEHGTARFVSEAGESAVLVAGGEADAAATATQILSGDTWDPIANGPVAFRSAGCAVGDPVGIARVFGGFDTSGQPMAACEWYDVKRGWRNAPSMLSARARFDAPLVAGLSDTVLAYLAVAGSGVAGPVPTTELFRLPSGAAPGGEWEEFDALTEAVSERRSAIDGANLPIALGGRDAAGSPISGVELYQPLRARDIDLGSWEVGRLSDSAIVVIENMWLLPVRVRNLRIDGSAEFLLRGDTSEFILPPGARRSLRVWFIPGAPGDRLGRLLLDVGGLTDTIMLRGRGAASDLAVLRSPLDVGSQLVGTRRIACAHLLRNTGSDSVLVDSISVSANGTFRLVSPIGGARIAPGDSLNVCVEFAPTARGVATADLTFHVGPRTVPLQVVGRGLRRYGLAEAVSLECDTVVYADGSESSGFIDVLNAGDTLLSLGLPVLTASDPSRFRLADSSAFPRSLVPGERMRVEVVFAPEREGTEFLTSVFPSDGDSVIAASLCFVARSRSLGASVQAVDYGALCTGDTGWTSVTIENRSGFDSIELIDATISPAGEFSLTGFTPGFMQPRAYQTLEISHLPTASGPIAGELTVRTNRGELRIAITGRVLPKIEFFVRALDATIGTTSTIELHAADAGGSNLSRAVLEFNYDRSLLLPRRVAPIDGAPALVRSELVAVAPGRARIELEWESPMAVSGPLVGIECEVLRGESTVAIVDLNGAPPGDVCIPAWSGTIELKAACGQPPPLFSHGAHMLRATPQPASSHLVLSLVSQERGDIRLELLDRFGRVVVQSEIIDDGSPRTLELSAELIPSGHYVARAIVRGRTIESVPVIIAR